jgi:large subunit ribosomal protein L10
MPAKWKFKEVEELTKLVKESPVVAIANIEGLPSKQMQEIRAKLHGLVTMKVVKNRLAKMAFEKAGIKGIKELEERIDGQTALIFSDENPFKLFQRFKASRVNAPAKAGQKAPTDIVVPAGDTPFKPGPIIADLQGVGIKAKIQGPIIVVQQDSPVIKEGDAFSSQLASVLAQMDIKPMVIGVNIRAALEKGTIYGSDVLDVSAEDTIAAMARCLAPCAAFTIMLGTVSLVA